uniref:Uncharacterized protein n=1 Tax=viral metagenome TaxID=1070528 RepID=A0A6C0BL47_9ZZZZ
MQLLYGTFVAIAIALIVYTRYSSSTEGFQVAPTPYCQTGFTPDGKGFCLGYVCHGGPEKKRADGTNMCSISGGKTTPATLTKHRAICGKGYATVTTTAGVITCVKT